MESGIENHCYVYNAAIGFARAIGFSSVLGSLAKIHCPCTDSFVGLRVFGFTTILFTPWVTMYSTNTIRGNFQLKSFF